MSPFGWIKEILRRNEDEMRRWLQKEVSEGRHQPARTAVHKEADGWTHV